MLPKKSETIFGTKMRIPTASAPTDERSTQPASMSLIVLACTETRGFNESVRRSYALFASSIQSTRTEQRMMSAHSTTLSLRTKERMPTQSAAMECSAIFLSSQIAVAIPRNACRALRSQIIILGNFGESFFC